MSRSCLRATNDDGSDLIAAPEAGIAVADRQMAEAIIDVASTVHDSDE